MKIIIKNDLTGQTKTVIVEDKFKSLSADLQNETVNEISEQIDWSKEPQVQESQVQSETIYKPMKTVEDINLLYLKIPVLIPCLVIFFFTIFIFKKKIKSGWSRILTVLSIFWALLCFFHFQMNHKKYRYYFEFEQQFPEDVKNVIMVTMLPILSMFFIAWAIKWILEGFKK